MSRTAATAALKIKYKRLDRHRYVKNNSISSALHEDILTLVFAELNTTDPIERTTCARGALVCRTWAEPALKALWRSLRSLLPLYGILLPVPPTVRKTYIGRWYIEYIGEIVNSKPFEDPAVWSPFLRCASRIRHLVDWDPGFDIRLLRALCHHNNGTTVLQALQSISWADAEEGRSDEALPLIASPSLQHLEYHINSVTSIRFVGNTLANILPKAPFLSSLKIIVDTRSTIRLKLLPFLWQSQRLRRLCLLGWQVITPSCLEGFSSFRTLEHLECYVEGFEAPNTIQVPFDVPNLLVLRLTGTGASMRGLIRTLRAPRLQELMVTAREKRGDPGRDAHHKLFHDMPTSPFAHSLQRFTYHSGPTDCAPPQHQVHPNCMSLIDLIDPLLSLRQLRRVSIVCQWEEMGLRDDEVLAMAEAWCDLEEIMLAMLERCREPLRDRSYWPTPLSLSHLHRLCPNLSFLALPIDMETSDASVPSHDIQKPDIPTHCLKRLDILGYRSLTAPQQDLEALAGYVHHTFPYVVPCAPFAISVDPWENVWGKLRSLRELQQGDVVKSQ